MGGETRCGMAPLAGIASKAVWSIGVACERSQSRRSGSRCGMGVKARAVRVNVFLRSVPVFRAREVRLLEPLTILWSLWAQRRRDLQSRSGDVIFSKSVHFSELLRRQARVQLSPTLAALSCEAGRAKHFGVLSRPVGTGGGSFELPKQRGFGGCEAVGVECCGESVLLSASRLAGESGSPDVSGPQSTALRREVCT